jgi:steroid delta-isomerase-like uncharacterized protein
MKGESTMVTEEHKDLIRRGLDFWNQGKLESADEIYASDYVRHKPPHLGDIHGLSAFKEWANGFLKAFPDSRFDAEDIISEGNMVTVRYIFHGTHKGEMMGMPPTQRKIVCEGIAINRIANGKIAETWDQFDNLGFLQQLGIIPQMGPSKER